METLVTNSYSNINPVKQHHRNGCWAACLEWWSKAVLGNNSVRQDRLRQESSIRSKYKSDSVSGTNYGTSHSMYGTLETSELLWLLQQARWGMQVQQFNGFTSADLTAKLASGPVMIGFFDLSGNTWHVNVICGYDSTMDMVVAMEPRTGEFLDKGFSDFTGWSAFNVIGWK